MAVLELVTSRPDWMGALTVALTRPQGVPERRGGEDPGRPGTAAAERPRRISDDLAWLRQASDEPDEHGLKGLEDTAAVVAWETDTRPRSGSRACATARCSTPPASSSRGRADRRLESPLGGSGTLTVWPTRLHRHQGTTQQAPGPDRGSGPQHFAVVDEDRYSSTS